MNMALQLSGRPNESPDPNPPETPPIEPDRIIEPAFPETPPRQPEQPGHRPEEYPVPNENSAD